MLLNTGAAAAVSKLSKDSIICLCEAGELRARRTRRGAWIDIDEGSLLEWAAAHPDIRSGAAAALAQQSSPPTDERAAYLGIPPSAPMNLAYDPARCHFCGKPATQTVSRTVPVGEGKFEERAVRYCGVC